MERKQIMIVAVIAAAVVIIAAAAAFALSGDDDNGPAYKSIELPDEELSMTIASGSATPYWSIMDVPGYGHVTYNFTLVDTGWTYRGDVQYDLLLRAEMVPDRDSGDKECKELWLSAHFRGDCQVMGASEAMSPTLIRQETVQSNYVLYDFSMSGDETRMFEISYRVLLSDDPATLNLRMEANFGNDDLVMSGNKAVELSLVPPVAG